MPQHTVPSIMRMPLQLVPERVHAAMFAMLINHLLRGQPLAARLHEVEGKSLCISITDVNCCFHYLFFSGSLVSVPTCKADVTISGTCDAFWKLGTRQEDADTLFFKRKLVIEGETETGLHIKNLLDSLEFDWDTHFDTVLPRPLSSIAGDFKKKSAAAKQRRAD